jgi:hypothetical protein
MGSPKRGTREDKARGGSGNTGKPPGNTGLPLTLDGKPVCATRGRKWRNLSMAAWGGWGRGCGKRSGT